MNFTELVKSNRTCRRYDNTKSISRETMLEMIDEIRYVPSGANRQVLKFAITCVPETNSKMFECLKWAGYLPEWTGPVEAERPTAYFILASDMNEGAAMTEDVGIAAQTLALSARFRGLAVCMFKAYDEAMVKNVFDLGENIRVEMVISMGYPVEEVVIDDIEKGQSIKYYRDGDGIHHVPKISRDDMLL